MIPLTSALSNGRPKTNMASDRASQLLVLKDLSRPISVASASTRLFDDCMGHSVDQPPSFGYGPTNDSSNLPYSIQHTEMFLRHFLRMTKAGGDIFQLVMEMPLGLTLAHYQVVSRGQQSAEDLVGGHDDRPKI